MSETLVVPEVSVEDRTHFVQYVRFVRRDPANNRHRFYLLNWQRSLEGELALVYTWGRLGTSGRSSVMFFPDRSQAVAKLERLMQRRLRRGYQALN